MSPSTNSAFAFSPQSVGVGSEWGLNAIQVQYVYKVAHLKTGTVEILSANNGIQNWNPGFGISSE